MLTAEHSFRLRKAEHLRSSADFRRVYEARASAGDDVLLVYAATNDLAFSRFGLSVNRKLGNAVKRNRLRRLCREAFRLMRSELPVGLDFVLIPRPAKDSSLENLKSALVKLTHAVAKRLARKGDET